MNSQAARVIRHFCLATRENENDVKRQYNATPAPLKHKALAYLQAATRELRRILQAQLDAAAMRAYMQDLIDNPPDLDGDPPTGPAATGVIPVDRRTEAQIRALATQGSPAA